jgi:hypothetical protein
MASAAIPLSLRGDDLERRWLTLYLALLLVVVTLAAFLALREIRTATSADTEAEATRYVQLALALDKMHPGEVDSWFGPAALEQPGPEFSTDLGQLDRALARLADNLYLTGEDHDEQRRAHLRDLVRRLADVRAITGESGRGGFYQEASSIYGIAPPTDAEAASWRRARAELDALLPGDGPLSARIEAFRARFVVPVERRAALFERALAECRARTLAQWALPAGERVDIVWTGAVPAAWHRYEGGLRSVLQVNRQALAMPGQAIDVACHEGYPGHHAQFVAADVAAGPAGLPIENRLTLLRSPESVIREGAADVGVELAFPAEERLAFLRDVLFPLAGFDPADAAAYARFEALERAASGASLPILASYRDGALDRDRAAAALADEALVASPGALLDFTDRYGAYVIGYTVARDRVRAALGSNCGNAWAALRGFVERPGTALLHLQAAHSATVSS